MQACRVINDESLNRGRTKFALQVRGEDGRKKRGCDKIFIYCMSLVAIRRGDRRISVQPRTAAEIEADYQNFIQQWRQPSLDQGAARMSLSELRGTKA